MVLSSCATTRSIPINFEQSKNTKYFNFSVNTKRANIYFTDDLFKRSFWEGKGVYEHPEAPPRLVHFIILFPLNLTADILFSWWGGGKWESQYQLDTEINIEILNSKAKPRSNYSFFIDDTEVKTAEDGYITMGFQKNTKYLQDISNLSKSLIFTKEDISELNKTFQEKGEISFSNPRKVMYKIITYNSSSYIDREDEIIKWKKNNLKSEYDELIVEKRKQAEDNEIFSILVEHEKIYSKKNIDITIEKGKAEVKRKKRELEAKRKAEEKRRKEEEAERKRIKIYLANLEPNLIKAAIVYSLAAKINYNMEYNLKYRTLSHDLQNKTYELQQFVQDTYDPAVQEFSQLASDYADVHGSMALRDLAIKNNFIHLLR